MSWGFPSAQTTVGMHTPCAPWCALLDCKGAQGADHPLPTWSAWDIPCCWQQSFKQHLHHQLVRHSMCKWDRLCHISSCLTVGCMDLLNIIEAAMKPLRQHHFVVSFQHHMAVDHQQLTHFCQCPCKFRTGINNDHSRKPGHWDEPIDKCNGFWKFSINCTSAMCKIWCNDFIWAICIVLVTSMAWCGLWNMDKNGHVPWLHGLNTCEQMPLHEMLCWMKCFLAQFIFTH